MTVISLAAAREERQPHWVGTAHCIGCHHEWVAVAPMASKWIECPKCALPKGCSKYPFGANEDDLVLTCAECSAETLTAYKRGGLTYVRCMSCGNDMTNAFYEG